MDIKKPQLVKVGAFAYFFEGVLQHPPKFLAKMSGRLHHEDVRSDYEIYCYAVILSLMRLVLALMSLIIRSWYSVF